MKRRARKALQPRDVQKARQLLARGDRDAAAELVASGRARTLGRQGDTALVPTHAGDAIPRGHQGAMEQGGWVDERSVMGYTLDASELRRKVVARCLMRGFSARL